MTANKSDDLPITKEMAHSFYDSLVQAYESHKRRKVEFESSLKPLLSQVILLLDDVENDLDLVLANKLCADLGALDPSRTENLMLLLNSIGFIKKVSLLRDLNQESKLESFGEIKSAADALNGLRNRLAHPRSVRNKLSVSIFWKGVEYNALEEAGINAIVEAVAQFRGSVVLLFPETKRYFETFRSPQAFGLREAYVRAIEAHQLPT